MKRAVHIVALALAFLVLAGCAKSFKDIKVTSFGLVSLVPRGLTAVDALVEVGIDNPVVGFEIFDMAGVIKLDGQPCLDLSADQLVVSGKSARMYSIPVKGSLADGFNPFSLLSLLQDIDTARITVDVKARVNLRGGVGKVIELKNLPLDKMLGGRIDSGEV